MKKVILIGDSIRLGYQSTVQELLMGQAEVWSPEPNCQQSTNHLLNLQEWYLSRQADVIHFNFGLWDCRRVLHNHSQNLVSQDEFSRDLALILEVLKQKTTSIPIWATITPVVEARHRATFPAPNDPYRVASDVEIYNAAAHPVLTRYNTAINDLHHFVSQNHKEEMIGPDGVHYTDAAYKRIGAQVANSIRKFL